MSSKTAFQIETADNLDSLLADHECWDSLAGGIPFRETSWLQPWWHRFGGDKRAHVVVARDDSGTIRGLLPLYRPAGTPGRTLSMIGDGDACSDHVSVLAKKEDAVMIAEAMGVHLASTAARPESGWDLIDIDGIVQGDTAMTALARGLKAGGAGLHTQSRMSTWFKPTDACWDDHLKHYGKTQRRRMRRMSEKIGNGRCFEKVVAESDSQVGELLEALIDMHQQRWNDVGESGSFRDPQFVDFIRETAESFFHRGRLYLTALKYEGRFVSAELGLIGDNRILYVYSAGFDIGASELEPGRVLGVDTLLELYRRNLRGIDYMRGDEEYKNRMSTESHRLLRMRAVAPTWLPRLRHAAWWTQFELKQWMRKQTGRPPIDVLDITSTPV